jgi:hypothetical protein
MQRKVKECVVRNIANNPTSGRQPVLHHFTLAEHFLQLRHLGAPLPDLAPQIMTNLRKTQHCDISNVMSQD